IGAVGGINSSSGDCPATGPSQGWCAGGQFVSGTMDGFFSAPAGLTLDTSAGYFYVLDGNQVDKFSLSSGVFEGAIGMLSSSTGSCPASGPSRGWCVGGVFDAGGEDGEFDGSFGSLDVDSSRGILFVADPNNYRVQAFSLNTGKFIGAIGALMNSTGSCPSSG